MSLAISLNEYMSTLILVIIITDQCLLKGKLMTHGTFKYLRATLFVPLAALCMVSIAQGQSASSAGMPQERMQTGTMGADDMKKSMMSGMNDMQNMQMSGDTDKDFAMMMKMHHQQALTMAQMELDHGKSSAMKAMAKKIIAAQKKEIIELDDWLANPK